MTELSALLDTYTPPAPDATADGKDARIIAQNGGSASGVGGSVTVQTGTAYASDGGSITLAPGTAAGSGTDGSFVCELPEYADSNAAYEAGLPANAWYHTGGALRTHIAPAFGVAADRINLLRPVRMEIDITLFEHETESTANYVYEWEPTYPGEFVDNGGTGDPYIAFSSATMAPNGSFTASKIQESFEDVPPEYDTKPAPWDLTGYHATWTDFWTDAVCVVPCWEGTGTPQYYVAGGAAGAALTQVGSPTWGTNAGHGACLRFPAGTHDWQVAPVGSLDIMPTAGMTMLWVRKMAVPQGVANYGIGLVGGGSTLYVTSGSVVATHFDSAFHTSAGGTTVEITPGTDIEMLAVVWGTTGTHFYYRSGLSEVQGVAIGADATAKGPRTRQNLPFGLATGRTASTTLGMDLLFFAALDDEWTETKVKEWMNDPYAPIRTDGGGTRELHEGAPVIHGLHAGVTDIGSSKAIRYRCAVYAKDAGRPRFQLEIANSRTALTQPRVHGAKATFDVSTGTVAIAAAAFGTHDGAGQHYEWLDPIATVTAKGDGWYLCELDVTCPSTTTTFFSNGVLCTLTLDNGSGAVLDESYPGDGVSGLYVWRSCLLPLRAFTDINSRQFHDHFDDPGTIDSDNTLEEGFNWYVENYAPGWHAALNSTPSPSSYYSVADSELNIVHDGTGGANRTLNSASWNGSGWTGYRFQLPILLEHKARWIHEGEADLSGDQANGVPAIWTQSSEALEFPELFSDTTPDSIGWVDYTGFAVPTSAASAAGTQVLTFAYVPTFMRVVGAFMWGTGIPIDTRIASATTTTVTLDKDIVAPGVALGDLAHVNWAVEHDFQEVRAWLEPFSPHTPYSSHIVMPGYSNEEISDIGGPAGDDYTTYRVYQTLWLPKTSTENGMYGVWTDGLFVDGSLRVYGPGIELSSGGWYYADEQGFHYPLMIGGGGRAPLDNFPGWWDYITVYGA